MYSRMMLYRFIDREVGNDFGGPLSCCESRVQTAPIAGCLKGVRRALFLGLDAVYIFVSNRLMPTLAWSHRRCYDRNTFPCLYLGSFGLDNNVDVILAQRRRADYHFASVVVV